MNIFSGNWEAEVSYLELFQDFISLPFIFTEVFDLLAFGATAVVFHLGALGVYFRALGLVTDRTVLRAHARAVRVAREEAFPELVHKATVIHAAFSSVVIENDVIVGSSLGLVRGGIVLRADRGRRDSGVQGEQHDANRREKRAHPSPRQSDAFKESVSGPLSCKSPCCKYDTERNVNNP